jgi:hypothetical protein
MSVKLLNYLSVSKTFQTAFAFQVVDIEVFVVVTEERQRKGECDAPNDRA